MVTHYNKLNTEHLIVRSTLSHKKVTRLFGRKVGCTAAILVFEWLVYIKKIRHSSAKREQPLLWLCDNSFI